MSTLYFLSGEGSLQENNASADKSRKPTTMTQDQQCTVALPCASYCQETQEDVPCNSSSQSILFHNN